MSLKGSAAALARWRRRLVAIEDGLLAFLLLALLAVAIGQILLRVVADAGTSWAEPVSRLLVMWLAVLGALAATRERRHIAIDALPRLLPPRAQRAAWALAQLTAAGICAVLAWLGADLIALELEAPTTLPGGLPSWVGMLVLPFGFGLMALRFAIAALLEPPRYELEFAAPGAGASPGTAGPRSGAPSP